MKKKLYYTYVSKRSFIETDLVKLREYFDVHPFEFTSTPKFVVPLTLIRQFFHLLFLGWKYESFACFFAGYHSVLPAFFARLTGKKCVVFLAGTDCFKYPSFHYGNYTKPLYGLATCITARMASILVPVSSNLINSNSNYYTVDSTQQGIYHWCKNLKTPNEVVPFEYNTRLFSPVAVSRIPNSFMSIAFGIEGTSFIRKGIDKVVMLAQHYPSHTFTIVGCNPDDFPVEIPLNVTLIPPTPHSEIPALLSAHQFYLQLSIAEGFPSAICEAMLCECIPIGSDVAAIPLIIGTNGFIVKERNDQLIIETVKRALDYDDKETLGKSARQYIIEHFGPGVRMGVLQKLFAPSVK